MAANKRADENYQVRSFKTAFQPNPNHRASKPTLPTRMCKAANHGFEGSLNLGQWSLQFLDYTRSIFGIGNIQL